VSLIIESYGISDIGLARANNEDVWAEIPEHNFFALADGMGGHQAGEIAAKETILELCDSIDDLFLNNPSLSVNTLIQGLRNGIKNANDWVRTLAEKHPHLTGMGTTLCCCLLFEHTLIYAHVGDSRIYRFRKNLKKLTEDHSRKQDTPSKGEKTVLTRAVGTLPDVKPDIETDLVQIGDIYFLCSDGLTDSVDEKEIEAILREGGPLREIAFNLVEAAKAGKGTDNISLVIIKIHPSSYETNLS
jgi:protein phosphatase